ncbi:MULTISPECIES: uracil-DNA glycosylase [Ramlibacter]|uniref:Type-4 uracil-DNA glycosylase n=1 Tax=Ramlibacter pinisoli TaxID=2682844 RepID=A0A6N8J3X8_9BURK|nr:MULTISPECIES: uracil-DNA glycosylase [Ramlibacter]MBA2962983.1 uracil-DNA glycosylase [Ramlibacter sp. CGMCC 1.13660]MVQ32926.1 uracil-DNA glycosylase [Ramlibacter pinisoli]
MTLQLDPRRVAMLREMGLQLLPPIAPPAAQAAVEPSAPPASLAAAAAPVARPVADASAAAPAPVAVVPPGAIASLDWAGLQAAVQDCRACGLCESRRNAVFGTGPATAEWLIVGEAPDEDADAAGEPFVGQDGQLLDNMLRSLGLDRRRNAYVANVLRCRPPGGRNPEPAELAQCEPFLRRQVELLQPRIILAMGRFAVQSLLQTTEPIGRLRGRVHRYHDVPLVVTFHPAYLLRNQPDKAKAWADLCLAMDLLEGRVAG